MNLVNDMTQVALTNDPVSGDHTYPVSPIVVNSETLSTTNPDGVIHVNATQAQAGETSTITVTATDPSTNTSQIAVVRGHGRPVDAVGQPTANAQSVTTAEATPAAITLTGSDPNTPPLPLTYTVTAGPAHGTLSGTAPNLTYTPDSGYFGSDSFQFTDSNGTSTSNAATVSITVVGQPTANAQSVTTAQGQANGDHAHRQRPEHAAAAADLHRHHQPGHGTLSGTAPDLTYTPDCRLLRPRQLPVHRQQRHR